MSRGKKSHYIHKITTKDTQMLHAFKSTGYLTNEHANEFVRDRRLAGFVRDKFLQKSAYYDKTTRQIIHVYSLTDKGKDLCKKELGTTYFYKSVSARHDLAVANHYMSLTQEQRDSWLTEGDLRARAIEQGNELEEKLETREISPTDGAYHDGKQIVTFEVITSSYGHHEIKAKEEFASAMGASIEFLRI